MRQALIATALLLSGTSAFAQTVDQPGAEALTATLKRYVGETVFSSNVLSVAPDGDAYRLTLDIDAALKTSPPKGADAISFEPRQYSLRLKPQPDGRWGVSVNLASKGAIEAKQETGQQTIKWETSGNTLDAVFDPAIAYLSSGSGVYGALSMLVDQQTEDGKEVTDIRLGGGVYSMEGKANANGGADFTSTHKVENFEETISVTSDDFSLDPTRIKAPTVDFNSGGVGVRTAELLELLAFAVANSDKTKIVAAQPELKTRLLAALPLWQSISSAYAFNDLEVSAPQGAFSASKAGLDFTMQGISASSSLSYGVTVSGPKFPAGLVPAWAEPILPTDVSMHFGGKNLNLDGPARKFIEAMDISKDPPVSDLVSAEILGEFMSANPMFTLTDTSIRNRDTEFTFEGEMTYPEWANADMTKVDATVTIEATGYDKLEDAVKNAAASDPTAAQAFPALLAMKGFGKSLPDGKLQWIVDVDPDGSVKVNGAMLKGPDVPGLPDEPLDPDSPAPGITSPEQ